MGGKASGFGARRRIRWASTQPRCSSGFSIASTPVGGRAADLALGGVQGSTDPNELPTIKPEDYQYFSKLMEDVDEDN
ncbi:MAG: hypothetical protein AAFX50_04340, partial [Acidobacteriota bacterium]